jgi:hypothetical protein
MAEEQSSLHIDLDWKKQAQEEKRRLAEEAASKPKAIPVPPPRAAASESAGSAKAGAGAGAAGARTAAGRDRNAPVNFVEIVQQFITQALFYLGEIDVRGQRGVNLDMAKYYVDMLGVLEEKTANNLTDEERVTLDAALYEARMRYVNVASQYT